VISGGDGKELVCENEDIPGDDAAVVEVEFVMFSKRVLGNSLLFETNNVEGRARRWGKFGAINDGWSEHELGDGFGRFQDGV
jgi:hypothetical protein